MIQPQNNIDMQILDYEYVEPAYLCDITDFDINIYQDVFRAMATNERWKTPCPMLVAYTDKLGLRIYTLHIFSNTK